MKFIITVGLSCLALWVGSTQADFSLLTENDCNDIKVNDDQYADCFQGWQLGDHETHTDNKVRRCICNIVKRKVHFKRLIDADVELLRDSIKRALEGILQSSEPLQAQFLPSASKRENFARLHDYQRLSVAAGRSLGSTRWFVDNVASLMQDSDSLADTAVTNPGLEATGATRLPDVCKRLSSEMAPTVKALDGLQKAARNQRFALEVGLMNRDLMDLLVVARFCRVFSLSAPL